MSVVHTADDGLRLAAERPQDAILLDFRMPFVNGVGFLYRLRGLPGLRDVPGMVITGASVDDEMLTARFECESSIQAGRIAGTVGRYSHSCRDTELRDLRNRSGGL